MKCFFWHFFYVNKVWHVKQIFTWCLNKRTNLCPIRPFPNKNPLFLSNSYFYSYQNHAHPQVCWQHLVVGLTIHHTRCLSHGAWSAIANPPPRTVVLSRCQWWGIFESVSSQKQKCVKSVSKVCQKCVKSVSTVCPKVKSVKFVAISET